MVALFMLVGPSSLALAKALPRTAPAVTRLVHCALSVAQLTVFMQVLFPLTYLAALAGAHFPLLDSTLVRLDATLFGFDSEAAAAWFADRPILGAVFSLA